MKVGDGERKRGSFLYAPGLKEEKELLSRAYSILSNVWVLHFIKSSQ